MRVRESVYCPYCRHPIQLMVRSHETYSEGCPLKRCPHCRNQYLDMRCKEPALMPFAKIHYFKNLLYGLSLSIGLSFFATIVIIICAPEEYVTRILLSFFILVTIASYGLLCWGENKNAAFFEMRWKESDARLRNEEYAKMLANAGFHVPSHYLPEGFEANPSILNILKM